MVLIIRTGDTDEDADMEAAIRMSLEHQEQQQQQSGSEQLSKNEEKTAGSSVPIW